MDENHQAFKDLVKLVENAETNDFCELAELLGRDPKTDYAGADLSYVDLSGCDLSHANLSNTNLSSCNLTNTNLRHSNLSGSDLTNANLQGSDLSYADLTNSNLSNVNLNSVDLSFVDLSVDRLDESQHRPPRLTEQKTQITTKSQDSFDVDEKKRELLNKFGFTHARQQSSDEGFENNYNIPTSLIQFRSDIRKQSTKEIEFFLELVQKHTECQLCSLFLIDDDGYFKCHGFYGFDSSGIKLSQKFFQAERYSIDYDKSAVAQAVKPDKFSRYGKTIVIDKNEISDKFFIDQKNIKIIEEICGELTSVAFTPINGPNRSYGVIRIIKTVHYPRFSFFSGFSSNHVWYLELAASQLAANLREINSSQKLVLISFMNRANLGILAARYQKSDQPWNNNLKILEYLSSIIEHLAHSQESCVKAATLRLFSKEENGLVTIAASSREIGAPKDTSIRRLSELPKPLVIKVYEDGLDCTITDLQKEIDSKPESTYNLQNKHWLQSCNFKSLMCLAIKVNEETIGTLVLYNGHKRVIANRDKAYFRVIADSLSVFISVAFSSNKAGSSRLDHFIEQFSRKELSPMITTSSQLDKEAIEMRLSSLGHLEKTKNS